MGTLYRRNPDGPWYGDFYTPEGKRVQRSLRTKDKAVAKERLRAAELSATPQARGRNQRLSEAIDYMITVLHDKADGTREMYAQKRDRIIKSLGDPFVHEINRDMLSDYIAKRLNPDDEVHGQAKPHTVSKELITVRKALREAHERGVLRVMPAFPRFSPRYKPKETWLNEQQFGRLVAELDPGRALWASLAALGGMSAGEVERLEWPMVDLRRSRIRVPGTKRDTRRRTIPIAPALAHRLRLAQDALRLASGAAATGKVVEHWGNVRRDLHAACKRAGVPPVSPNDLRRTFASWLVQQGVPLLTVSALLGHSSTRMVEKVYGKLSEANLDDAVALLPSWGAPQLPDPGVTDGVTNPVSLGATPEHLGDKPADPDEE